MELYSQNEQDKELELEYKQYTGLVIDEIKFSTDPITGESTVGIMLRGGKAFGFASKELKVTSRS